MFCALLLFANNKGRFSNRFVSEFVYFDNPRVRDQIIVHVLIFICKRNAPAAQPWILFYSENSPSTPLKASTGEFERKPL